MILITIAKVSPNAFFLSFSMLILSFFQRFSFCVLSLSFRNRQSNPSSLSLKILHDVFLGTLDAMRRKSFSYRINKISFTSVISHLKVPIKIEIYKKNCEDERWAAAAASRVAEHWLLKIPNTSSAEERKGKERRMLTH